MNASPAGLAGLEAPSVEPTARVNIPFEFRGSGPEYFRIWIVNLLLTIVTLGIYSAWAKVRRMRYFYGNTFLDGHSFEYHAKPLAILKGRLIVFGAYVVFVVVTQVAPMMALLFLPLVLFGMPWVIMRARKFQMRVTSYRNLRFNFHGTYGDAMSAFIGWYFIAMLTLGILFPMWVRRRVAYVLGNSAYGQTPFRFVTSNGRFFAFCYATVAMSVVAYALFFFVLFQIGLFDPAAQDADPAEIARIIGVSGFLMLLMVAAVAMAIWGYYQASLANASFGGIEIGQVRVVSTLGAGSLAGIHVTNLLGIVFTLGLFYPWAKVRLAKYQLENTSLDTAGGLGEFTASAGTATDALGEEIGEFFDVDLGI